MNNNNKKEDKKRKKPILRASHQLVLRVGKTRHFFYFCFFSVFLFSNAEKKIYSGLMLVKKNRPRDGYQPSLGR